MALKAEKKEQVLSGAPSGKGETQRYKLTTLSLWLVLIAIVGVLALIAFSDFDGSKEMTTNIPSLSSLVKKDSAANRQALDSLSHQYQVLVQAIHEEKKDYREFFLKIAQMILLNLLLPILTAILGYKVGAKDHE